MLGESDRRVSVSTDKSSISSMWSDITSTTSASTRKSSLSTSFQVTEISQNIKTGVKSIRKRKLPPEVLSCILQHLRNIHEANNSVSCSSCFNRDAYNLALVSRAWDAAVKKELYHRIRLDGLDSPSQLKRHKLQAGVRFKLLRRTLKDRTARAATVRELRVSNPSPNADVPEKILDQIASIVMVCPNLESFTGVHPSYTHEFSRLFQALGTRKKLKTHLWLIGDNKEISDNATWSLPPGIVTPERASMFLEFHTLWHNLKTLVLHAQPGAILEHGMFVSMFRLLPSLEHVSVSSFDADDFNDATLLSLRPLTSLRLAYLPGITLNGISAFTTSQQRYKLESLSLISLPVLSLLMISKILYNLRLKRFIFSQQRVPVIPEDAFVIMPVLTSRTLEYLHWDIQAPQGADTATPHLAASIFHHGFPRLRTIRAPSDSGTLQSLCAPLAQINLPSDKFSSAGRNLAGAAQTPGHSLRAARTRAQARIEAARKNVGVRLIVSDVDGKTSQDILYPGWMGRVGSPLKYVLDSDLGNPDRALVQEEDLLDLPPKGKDGTTGCTGLWNASHGGGKKWYGHVERRRWKGISVEKLF
jgi:hypothetical protein